MKWTKSLPTEEGLYLTYHPGYKDLMDGALDYAEFGLIVMPTEFELSASTYFYGPIEPPKFEEKGD